MNIVVLYGSTREQGNTELLTEKVVKDLPVNRVFLKDFHIKAIVDQRHEEGGFTPVDDDYDLITSSLLEADLIVFATPIYWYSMSGVMKTFIDRWSQTARDDRFPNFKTTMSGKPVYLIAVGGDQPEVKGLPLVHQFEYICEFMNLTFRDYVLGEGVKPGDVLRDTKALEKAEVLNRQLKRTIN